MSLATSLGLIETFGMTAAVTAADAAVKSANVELLGYELTRGQGLVTIKLVGDVGAVNAAVEAGAMAASVVGRVFSKHVIPRPHQELDKMLYEQSAGEEKNRSGIDQQSQEENLTEEQITTEILEKDNLEKVPEGISDEMEEVETNQAEIESSDGKEREENDLCNLCYDPKCPRKKRELKSLCIHNTKGGISNE